MATKVAMGMERAGSWASSPLVAIPSKPMKAKKQEAAPATTPPVPYGKKPLPPVQFDSFANVIPYTVTNRITAFNQSDSSLRDTSETGT